MKVDVLDGDIACFFMVSVPEQGVDLTIIDRNSPEAFDHSMSVNKDRS